MRQIQKGDLTITLSDPGEYYKGTRFDYSGVFRKILKGSYVLADEWFSVYDPFTHDAVCGPSEEFVTVDFDGVDAGGLFFKPGVGLLKRPDGKEYDRFRLYRIMDPGKWDIEQGDDFISYHHHLDSLYEYFKTIRLISDCKFVIEHKIRYLGEGKLEGHSYNHNFFTFNGSEVGPDRKVVFPFKPEGTWRDADTPARIEGNCIIFDSKLSEGSVFMPKFHSAEGAMPAEYRISEGQVAVNVKCSKDMDYAVFWSNRRVCCVEPYIPISLNKGESTEWTIEYTLET